MPNFTKKRKKVKTNRTLPPKLSEIIAFNWQFPTDFPVVNNLETPDASRALKGVIINALQNYYLDYRINTHNVKEFTRRFQNRLYNKMVQHQYWIDQYLNLINDDQFFYNDEEQNFSHSTSATSVDNGLVKNSDTPQNNVSDLDDYLTSATKNDLTNTATGTETEHNTIHKSTLGDITVQFRNFANFDNFIDQLIQAVNPCFLTTFNKDYDDETDYIGFTFEKVTNPNRTLVYDVMGNYFATLTESAKTVEIIGSERTFTEVSQGVSDSFERTNSSSFGRAEAGGKYFITESVAGDFNVSGGIGTMNCSTVNASRRATLTQTNSLKAFSGQVKIKTNKAAEGAGQDGGITFGYIDLLNHYEAVLRFSSSGNVQIGIIKKIDGDTNNIGSFAVIASSRDINDWWRLKVYWNSDTGEIKAKAWIVGTAEPANWQTEQVDTTYKSGRLGLRSIINSGTTNAPVLFSYDDFVGNGTWPTNPTVKHASWIRLLENEFNGTIDTGIIEWLKGNVGNTENDLLAELMRYVYTHDLDAHYGPVDSDGVRRDGSDWNDYLYQTAYYPGESEPEDPPEPNQIGCVDCSGYARLVLRGFGIPVSRYPDTFDGIHIPRESKDIMDNGPGLNVVPRNGVVQLTDFTKLQIGDLVGFDADLTDPEEGQIDHLGFYIGKDIFGKRRFISSRSTADGPTFSDLGGLSVIDGTTNLYTRSLRCIRRV